MRARSKLKTYDAENSAVAAVILANPAKYAGIQLLWAQVLLKRTKNHKTGGFPPEKRGTTHANFCEGRC